METVHGVATGDARSLPLPDESVDLVVTSPPYPMIEMWDGAYSAQDPAVAEALDAGDGDRAFDLMHDLLAEAWAECHRVLAEGAIAVVNVGDATRTLDGRFRQYPNHAEITSRMTDLGFDALPDVLWRKPTNSAAKFMGSGMLPTNAYPTLEHEHLLVFRKGGTRRFPPADETRYESAYFWTERNTWFSDVWELAGAPQSLSVSRERSGAFPLALPFRLICMFSVYGDVVLDPFWGTGTTTEAAMCAARSSVGVERDPELVAAFDPDGVAERSRDVAAARLERQRAFVAEDGGTAGYESRHYDFPVVTSQETDLRLYAVEDVAATPGGYRVTHEPV